MAKYKLRIKPSAVKELESVPKKDQSKIVSKIRSLVDDPRPPGSQKLSGDEKYRIRQGVYRILYLIEDEELIIIVVKIAHRKDVYR